MKSWGLFIVALMFGVSAYADIYFISAWQKDGRLDEKLPELGKITHNFFQKAVGFKSAAQLDGFMSSSYLKYKIQQMNRLALQEKQKSKNEQILVLTLSTHGWTFEGIHYHFQKDVPAEEITMRACVREAGPMNSDTECGLLSSVELAQMLQGTSFDKILLMSGACYSGQMIEDFSNFNFSDKKIILITSVQKEYPAVVTVFENNLKRVFASTTPEKFLNASGAELGALMFYPKYVEMYESLSPFQNPVRFLQTTQVWSSGK